MRIIFRIIFVFIFSFRVYAQDQGRVWKNITPMPTPRYGICSVVYHDKIWVIGGKDANDNTLDIIESYDPETDLWGTNIPPLQIKRFAAASVVYRDTIFVIGGTDENNLVLDAVEYFDPGSNQWNVTKSLIQPRGALTSVVLNDTMYAIGGVGQFHSIRRDDVEFWNVKQKQWQISTTWQLSHPRFSMATVAVSGAAYTLGGIYLDPVNFVENYQSNIGTIELDTMLFRRFGFGATVVNDTIFIIGGSKSPYELVNTIEKYYPHTNEWSIFDPPLNEARTFLTVESFNQCIYVFGGFKWVWEGFRPQMQIVDSSEKIVIASPTSVEQYTSLVPTEFKLLQNYPNPFNAQTIITFHVPEKNDNSIRLDIININGQVVKSYNWQSLSAGKHQIIWDGRNEAGQEVTSGIYLYQLSVDGYFETIHKMTLLR